MGDSDYLFARPSFWGGAASVLDIAGTLVEFNRTEGDAAADLRAIQADWNALKSDFLKAMEPYEADIIGF